MIESTADSIAAYWALKLHDDTMTDVERQTFTAWLGESDKHQRILKKAQSILEMTERTSDAADEVLLDAEFAAAIDSPAPGFIWQRTLPLMAASAAILFLSVAVWLWSNTSDPTRLATVKGEKVEFDLADGSRAILNTESRIEVDVSQTQRHVSIERGEVYFDVTPDRDRPFVVSANGVEIVVVGTKFNVRTNAGVTTVSVISGVVEVALQDNSNTNTSVLQEAMISLQQGNELVYAMHTQSVDIQSFDAQRIGAWLNGKAIYDGEPLEYVIADLNRYFPRRLELGDASLSDIPVSGTFDLTNSVATVEGLTVALSLQQIQTAKGVIRLVPEDRQLIEPRE